MQADIQLDNTYFACRMGHLLSQAEKFRSKAQKSDAFRSSQQYCRYLYYLGRIRTVQLEYTDAKDCLQQVCGGNTAQVVLLPSNPAGM